MANTLYVGMDPGLNGAVAIIDSKGKAKAVFDTPTVGQGKKRRLSPIMLRMALRRRVEGHRLDSAIESVHAYQGESAGSSFAFGRTLGVLEAVATEFGHVGYYLPKDWQATFGLPGGKEGRALSIEEAKVVFPEAVGHLQRKKDHGRAAALLIARHHLSLTEKGRYQ